MERLQSLKDKWSPVFEIDPAAQGRKIVFGEGNGEHPSVLLIGEAPGAQEESQGRPFVGKAGKNLDGFLQVVGLKREEIWITNVVKIRPFKVSPKGTISNRPPNQKELNLFTPFLHEELALIQPQVIVTLGNTALHAVAGKDINIGDCHGQLREAVLPNGNRVMLFPLYHPASIIYNRALVSVYDADLVALRENLSTQGL